MKCCVPVLTLVLIGTAISLSAEEQAKNDPSGHWKVTTVEHEGEPDNSGRFSTFRFDDGKFEIIQSNSILGAGEYTTDTSGEPATIDLKSGEKYKKLPKLFGIYQMDGDKLVLCLSDKQRPTSFKTENADGSTVKFTLTLQPKTE